MPFDPAKPVEGTLCDAAEMRTQLTSIHALIPQSVTIGSVTTGAPGSPASANVSLAAGVMTFTFTLPEGQPGTPGEVTQAQLSNDLVNMSNYTLNQVLPLTSANTNAVALLALTISDPPTQAEVQAIQDKLNEHLLAARR